MTLIPGQSNLSNPIQIRREEDFYISSNIEINCSSSFQLTYQWIINNCSSTNCSMSTRINSNQISTFNEYFLPARTLPLGLYQIQLLVTVQTSSSLTLSQSIYLLITPAGITANLVQLGTSMITSGVQQNLQFNPGLFSVDLDNDQFNATVSQSAFLWIILMILFIGLVLWILLSSLWIQFFS